MPIEFGGLLRHLLAVADDAIRGDVPQHAEIWDELSGRYQLPPRISDLRQRLIFGGGVQIFVRGGRLMLRVLTPVPALFRASICTRMTSGTRMYSGSICRSSRLGWSPLCSAAKPASA
jgi:hypothetical protein